MMRSILGIIFGACALFSGMATAVDMKLSVGEWSPYVSEKLKHQGFMAYIYAEAFAKAGDKVTYSFLPWKRAFEDAKKGKFDGSIGWIKNQEREKDFLYSAPVFAGKQVFIHRKGEAIIWNDLNDLGKYKMGGVVGYAYGPLDPLIKSGAIKMNRVSKQNSNFKKLVDGKIDLLPVSWAVGNQMVRDMNLQDQLVATEKPFTTSEYHLIVSKQLANGPQIIERFNKGLADLKSSGEYQQILEDSKSGKFN